MKYFLYFIFFFLPTSVLFAGGNISYLHQEVTVDSIADHDGDWQEYSKPFNKGFENGLYWFKIELPAVRKDRILSLPESHISRVRLFIEGKEIHKNEPNRYVSFTIPGSEKTQIAYLRVNCLLEARIPIEIEEYDAHYRAERTDYFVLGAYIGIILLIISFNILSYRSFGNRTYLFYVFMVVGLSSNALYKDGVSAYLFGINGFNEVLEPFINIIVPISAVFFTASYLGHKKELARLKKFGVFIILITVPALAIYLYSGSFTVFASIAVLNILSTTIFYFSGPVLWKKSSYAKFFTVAYGIPLFFAYDYHIFPHFGIDFLNLPLGFYKLGSITEMFVFSYAVMYQAKQIDTENKAMRQELINYTQKLKNLNKGVMERPDTITDLVEKFGLTLKEIEILKVLSLNKTNKEIAEMQFVSENTVKYHIKNICKKLGVHSKKEAQDHYLNFHS